MFFHLHFIQLFRGAAFVICAVFFALTANAATQTDITGPTGSSTFGTRVYNLPNGNIVVTDPTYNIGTTSGVGAVRLYNGATNALISTLTGSKANDNVGGGGVIILTNGNYVVSSPSWSNGSLAGAGAATYCDAATGINGTVSTTNSLVGGVANDQVSRGDATAGSGIIPLTNGNYVVRNSSRNNGSANAAGIVTFVNSATSTTGTATNANSLVGSTSGDLVGTNVFPLPNGNYIVTSPSWDSGAVTNVGAVTFGDGTTGISGAVSSSNSLIGSTTNDSVGFTSSGEISITILTNSNYVVRSNLWDNGATIEAGAVTFGNGVTGISGIVSAANSLVGTKANDTVGGRSVTALTNGNYVISSRFWDNGAITDAGAVTWGDGTTGISGAISSSNSLVGSHNSDYVGGDSTSNAAGGVTALTNGNYVVASTRWNGGQQVGAATWGNGTTGTSGVVSSTNSLVGTGSSSYVGFGGVTALTNGNYVVGNGFSATFGNGATGVTGNLSSANSLVWTSGSIGGNAVTALTNGNYVVKSLLNSGFGAATWGNGTSGTTGTVSSANSLVGSVVSDQVGNGGVTALSNGNYVVISSAWNGNRGAVTLGNGGGGTIGTISATNSLIGSTTTDRIGLDGITALTNGNYVVKSRLYNSNFGAVTWGDGINGTTGAVSSTNSLVGSAANDFLGLTVAALTNGNYLIFSLQYDNGAITNAGAVTYGAGNGGTVGTITATNSVRGTVASGGANLVFVFEPVNEQLVVGRPNSNIVSLFRPTHTAIVNGNSSAAATWDYEAFNRTGDVVVPPDRSVTLNHNFTANSLTVPAGASVSTNNNRLLTLNTVALDGFLNLAGGGFDTNGGTINTGNSGTISGADSSNYISRSTVQRTLTAGDSYTFDVGTMSGYAPVTFSSITGSGQVTVTPQQGTYPNTATGLPANRLARWWTLANPGGGITQTNITFGYQPSDVTGTERNYFVYRIPTGGGAATQIAGGINAVKHLINASNVTGFSDWTAADSGMPTAAGVAVSGRVATTNGRGINNVRVTLTDTHGQSRTISTGSFGYYRFENVAAGRDYIISVAAKRYSFNEPSRLLSVTSALDGINFTPLDNYSGK